MASAACTEPMRDRSRLAFRTVPKLCVMNVKSTLGTIARGQNLANVPEESAAWSASEDPGSATTEASEDWQLSGNSREKQI
jgi:hypothetical protein